MKCNNGPVTTQMPRQSTHPFSSMLHRPLYTCGEKLDNAFNENCLSQLRVDLRYKLFIKHLGERQGEKQLAVWEV